MKFLVLSAIVAVTSGQGFFGLQGNPDGTVTPLDEPVVAAKKAEHLATKFGGLGLPIGATYAAGYDNYAAAGPFYGQQLPLALSDYGYLAPYAGPLHFPTLVAHPNGAVVPADEPAVVAARAEHLAAHGVAYGGVYAAGYAAPSFYGLVAHPNGAVVPVDEPAVAAARAEHFAAHDAVYGGVYAAASPVGYAAGSPVGYAAGYAAPSFYGLVAHPNGAVVPVDEPAVAAARAEHLFAHGAGREAVYAAGYAAPSFYGLVAHPNGAVVPVDEPAVAAARAEHLAAFGK